MVLKNNMASKIENKKLIMDPYDGNDSISFDISKIISSTTSQYSYISLASTNNIKMTFKENICF